MDNVLCSLLWVGSYLDKEVKTLVMARKSSLFQSSERFVALERSSEMARRSSELARRSFEFTSQFLTFPA